MIFLNPAQGGVSKLESLKVVREGTYELIRVPTSGAHVFDVSLVSGGHSWSVRSQPCVARGAGMTGGNTIYHITARKDPQHEVGG